MEPAGHDGDARNAGYGCVGKPDAADARDAATKPAEPPPGEPGNPGDPEPPNDEPPTCNLCFAAGTPVHTQEGDVPIEKIVVGEEVLSRNAKTGALEYEPVTALTPIHRDKLLDIRIEGEATPLRPSTGHPFWVKRGGWAGAWIAAGEMRVGDLVQTIEGQWKRVVAITPEKDSQTVYNFTVDLNHDYFVGETGFLVHNAGSCNCQPTSPAFLYALFDGFGNF